MINHRGKSFEGEAQGAMKVCNKDSRGRGCGCLEGLPKVSFALRSGDVVLEC